MLSMSFCFSYYMFHTYIPTCLIVMMSWISFWIKPEAVPARVTLGVTSLLTLATQHANSQKSLPPVSYIKVRYFPLDKGRQCPKVTTTNAPLLMTIFRLILEVLN